MQDDTGLWWLYLRPQIQQHSFVLGQQVLLQQYAAELEQNILMQGQSVVDLASHSSDKSVGLLKESSKKSLLAVAVGDLVTGNSGQRFVAQLMVKYFL